MPLLSTSHNPEACVPVLSKIPLIVSLKLGSTGISIVNWFSIIGHDVGDVKVKIPFLITPPQEKSEKLKVTFVIPVLLGLTISCRTPKSVDAVHMPAIDNFLSS